MNLIIVTPQKATTIANVDKVSVPGFMGNFMVLQGHAPLVSTLTKGAVRYTQRGAESTLEVAGGMVEVGGNEVKIIIEQ